MWFIPDVTMVGATTVSLMTHLMTSLCVKSTLEVEPDNSRIDLGSLRNGSSRFLRVDPEELGVQDIMQQREVDVHMRLGEVSVRVKAPIVHLDADADEEVKGVDVAEQRSLFERAEVVDRLSSLLREVNRLTRVTYERGHISLMKKLTDLAEEAAKLGLDDIAEDIVSDEGHLGQVCKCLSKQEWYFSWGQRWLQTFEFAHKAQTKVRFLYVYKTPHIVNCASTVSTKHPLDCISARTGTCPFMRSCYLHHRRVVWRVLLAFTLRITTFGKMLRTRATSYLKVFSQ